MMLFSLALSFLHVIVDEMPWELLFYISQLAFGKIGFIICHFTIVSRTY